MSPNQDCENRKTVLSAFLVCDPPEFHIGEFADGDENGDADDAAGGRGGDAEVLV